MMHNRLSVKLILITIFTNIWVATIKKGAPNEIAKIENLPIFVNDYKFIQPQTTNFLFSNFIKFW